jgi:1-acyl-sn-glycerol-3-phosphate acyltransferase
MVWGHGRMTQCREEECHIRDHSQHAGPGEQVQTAACGDEDGGMSPAGATNPSYDDLLTAGRAFFPGIRIGRPGRARSYWATIAALRLLRARWKVDVEGAGHVAPGATVLIGNHVSALDPVVVVMSAWWRVTAFTKLEWFQGRGAPFFRLMGQIPLRRGDPAATDWAIAMASAALAYGGKIGLYPEGTRSPDPAVLHRLHGRVLIPVLRAHPGVPVHAVTTAYTRRAGRRTRVRVRISPPLALDPCGMDPTELIAVVREALLTLGGQTYRDESAHDVKRKRSGG